MFLPITISDKLHTVFLVRSLFRLNVREEIYFCFPDIDSILSKPIGPFCRKLQELQKLDSAFMSIYSNIYNILWPVFSNNNVTSLFPYSWQYDLCACILNEIRLIEILKKCCKESSNVSRWVTAAEGTVKSYETLLDVLMYAHDILSTSKQGLQNSLNIL